MTGKEMWAEYIARNPQHSEAGVEIWCYGAAPDELATLTLSGIKTATASAYPLYIFENSPIPKAGDFSVITDSSDNAVCIICTTGVDVVPFDLVDANHAFCEGEGDRSLEYWRKVHEEFFIREMASIGQKFTPEMPVVCEKFIKVYPV